MGEFHASLRKKVTPCLNIKQNEIIHNLNKKKRDGKLIKISHRVAILRLRKIKIDRQQAKSASAIYSAYKNIGPLGNILKYIFKS